MRAVKSLFGGVVLTFWGPGSFWPGLF